MSKRATTAHQKQLRGALIALCITELIAWGILYYALPVAIESINSDTSWSRAAITAAFSAGLVCSAFLGIPVGWALERWGPRYLMCSGTIAVIPAMLLIALAPSYPVFVAGWLLCSYSMATLFYQPAFAAITAWFGTRRVQGIMWVTLTGGLASTVFAPLTSTLLRSTDWRSTFLILGAVLVTICLPLQWHLLAVAWSPVVRTKDSTEIQGVAAIVRSRRFIVLAGSITAYVFASFAVVMSIVSLMTERGHSHQFGAILLGVVGFGQVVGRAAYSRVAQRIGLSARNLTILGTVAGTLLLFGLIPGPAVVLLAIALVCGIGRGGGTMMQATMVADIWGTQRYGALGGVFSFPVTLATALAPWAGAAIAAAAGSYAMMSVLMAALIAIAALGVLWAGREPVSAVRATSSA